MYDWDLLQGYAEGTPLQAVMEFLQCGEDLNR